LSLSYDVGFERLPHSFTSFGASHNNRRHDWCYYGASGNKLHFGNAFKVLYLSFHIREQHIIRIILRQNTHHRQRLMLTMLKKVKYHIKVTCRRTKYGSNQTYNSTGLFLVIQLKTTVNIENLHHACFLRNSNLSIEPHHSLTVWHIRFTILPTSALESKDTMTKIKNSPALETFISCHCRKHELHKLITKPLSFSLHQKCLYVLVTMIICDRCAIFRV
jgi:hypothetical protein